MAQGGARVGLPFQNIGIPARFSRHRLEKARLLMGILISLQIISEAAVQADAETCPTGQTLERFNGTAQCVPCTTCGPGTEPATPCTLEKDTVCRPCPNDTYSSVTSLSIKCTVCSSVLCSGTLFKRLHLRKCTATKDTSCDACGEGYYLGGAKRCTPCRRCQPDEEEHQPCTLETNRVCKVKPPPATEVLKHTTPPVEKHTTPPPYTSRASSTDKATSAVGLGSLVTSYQGPNASLKAVVPRTTSKDSIHGSPMQPPATSLSDDSADDSADEEIPIVVGTTVSGAGVGVLLGYVLFRCREKRNRKKGPDEEPTHEGQATGPAEAHTNADWRINFPPGEAVKRSKKIKDAPEPFLQRLYTILSHRRDWRALLAPFNLTDDSAFLPWRDDKNASEKEPVKILLKKISEKEVEQLYAKSLEIGLQEAAAYMWAAHKAAQSNGQLYITAATSTS